MANNTQQSQLCGRMYVVLAGVLWSSSGFFAKSPALAGWDGSVIAFWRAVFAAIVLIPLVRRPRWSWQLIPMMVFFATMNFTYLKALVISPANAIWLQNTAPSWTLLFGYFFLGERPKFRDWCLVGLSAAGVIVIIVFECLNMKSGSYDQRVECLLYGLASGFLYSGVVLTLKSLRTMEPAFLVALNHAVTVLALLPFAWNSTHFPSGAQWFLLAGFGVFQMGLPYVLFAKSLQSIPSHEASGIGLLEPILLPVWVYLAWGIAPASWTIAGGALILCGLIARYWPDRATKKLAEETASAT